MQVNGVDIQDPATGEIIHVDIYIIISPDGKMASILMGQAANGSEFFCGRCPCCATDLQNCPFKEWADCTTAVRFPPFCNISLIQVSRQIPVVFLVFSDFQYG